LFVGKGIAEVHLATVPRPKKRTVTGLFHHLACLVKTRST
jgi:hypothetical protein